jgi:bifunctional non-homologous end joining protein LigD
LPIAGFALDGEKWDGLYVGRQTGKELIYAVKVDHGFDKPSAAELRRRLMPLIRKTQPCQAHSHRGVWVEPTLLAEIEYRAKSAGGKGAASFLQRIARGPLNPGQRNSHERPRAGSSDAG